MNPLIREVDLVAGYIGELSRRSDAGTWERLLLMPALMLVLALIVAQESVRVLLGLPRHVERVVGAFPALIAPEHVVLTLVVALSLLLLGGVLVYRRSMARAHAAGLDQ